MRRAVWALLAVYGLNAAGLVPHMVFLVDFIARFLHQGLAVGAGYWVVFGIGAMAGPLLAGALADRIGFRRALRLAFLLQAVAVALPALTSATPWLLVSSAIAGAFTPGIVPLALGRVHELLPGDPSRSAWCGAARPWPGRCSRLARPTAIRGCSAGQAATTRCCSRSAPAPWFWPW